MIRLAPYARARTQMPSLDQALRAARLQADQGLRLTNAWLDGLRLLTKGGSSWNELSAIGTTTLQRLVDLQVGWTRDWLEWLRFASQFDGPIRAAQLLSEQYVALLSLLQTVEVDVSRISARNAPTLPPT